MKKTVMRMAVFLFIIMYILPQGVLAAQTLVPGGQVLGLEVENGTVTVAGFAQDSPARTAGVREGDRLLKIDGTPVGSAQEVRRALDRSRGTVTLTLGRGKSEKSIRLAPAISPQGPKLGVYLKEGVTGVGTLTFFDPDTGAFGALGHGVSSPQGKLLTLTGGSIFDAQVASVRKGAAGSPGQLVGKLTRPEAVGTLEKNTHQGIFGKTREKFSGQPLPVADPEDIREGKATIRSTVTGREVQEYSVEILKIYPNSSEKGRNLLLRVTDPRLLEATGGIVQGMSGSPIIQNGCLVGAVTHVLVNDPTTGYGIFIENMLEAAG